MSPKIQNLVALYTHHHPASGHPADRANGRRWERKKENQKQKRKRKTRKENFHTHTVPGVSFLGDGYQI